MLRTIRRAVTVAAVATAVTVAAAGGAVAETSVGDTTCAFGFAAAGTPPAFVVAHVADTAQATATCVSVQGENRTAVLSVWVEYQPYDGAAYQPVPGCYVTTWSRGTVGVLVATSPVVTCAHTLGDRPRRAGASLTYGGCAYRGYAPLTLDAYPVRVTGGAVSVDVDSSTSGC